MSEDPRVVTENDGHVLLIGLNRPAKRNAFDLAMLRELAAALTRYEDDALLRCAVLHAFGDHFTAGLDLAEVGPAIGSGEQMFPEGSVDPLGLFGRKRVKPLVVAVHGWCLTIGIELLLAADIRIAGKTARFAQIEINRGIFPFGGATIRLPQVAGWGNAMRWLLTGDEFDAAEAFRIGLLQEVVEPGAELERAIEIAQTVAKRAPLGVQATLESARLAIEQGPEAATRALPGQAAALSKTSDAREGLVSFIERREGRFTGK